MILCIDPGYLESAYVLLDGNTPIEWDKIPNDALLNHLDEIKADAMIMEQIEGFGMPAGKELFETVFVSGRMCEKWGRRGVWHRMPRKEVKIEICGTTKANDANVRQALIDRYGGESVAIGGKKCQACKGKCWTGRERAVCAACDGSGWRFPPGPLSGMHADCWQALALGRAWLENNEVVSCR